MIKIAVFERVIDLVLDEVSDGKRFLTIRMEEGDEAIVILKSNRPGALRVKVVDQEV